MKYILDTNTIIFWLKNVENVKNNINIHQKDIITTTIITMCELYYGVAKSDPENRDKNYIQVKKLSARIRYKSISEEASEKFGNLKKKLRTAGEIIDDFDLLIAAICMSENAVLVSDNVKHFKRIKGLKVENWR